METKTLLNKIRTQYFFEYGFWLAYGQSYVPDNMTAEDKKEFEAGYNHAKNGGTL